MDFSPQQDQALSAIADWHGQESGRKPFFYLAGYAGTGKTTLAKHIAEGIDGDVVFGAFTGKAAMVLRNKGCEGASTIHSLIYHAREKAPGVFEYVLNDDSPVRDAKLVVIDECSMVGNILGSDLLSYETPVLVLGDPAQLPPVKDTGYFTGGEPDLLLTEVHRQAKDNPIIALSMKVREGERLDPGSYGDSKIISALNVDRQEVMDANQILVGKNQTRQMYNKRLRCLNGFEGTMPQEGEKLVCLRNSKPKGLLNGSIWSVVEAEPEHMFGFDGVGMVVAPEDEGAGDTNVETWTPLEFFRGAERDLPWEVLKRSEQFTYGYALTVHKSQGSQWDDVYLFNEAHAFREDAQRWLYTGITRAAEKVTVVQ